ncbi:MAG TPA: lysylphosphatidylglycerol synthase transmembrane domain-containing protein [Gemmatimonadaceae bacterium]|nr:lysylphosphatidylglycerol synthase transmembrane domain-containing protein [Gemmatimonadaceae bacterium]
MRVSWRGAIGLALTVFLLWLALHNVSWSDVRADLRAANVPLVIIAVVLATMVFPLRAIRWRPILHPVAPNLPYGPLWRATAIGFMANNILPARAGELVRAYVLSRETSVTFSAAFASLVVDRVFDGVIVILLMVLAMFDPRLPADTMVAGRPASNYAGSGIVVLLVVAAALYAIVFFPGRLIRIYELFARRVAPRFEEPGKALLRSFADGLSVLRHPGRFLIVFGWALAMWLTQVVAFWIMFRALHIDAPFSAAMFVQGLIVLGVALPSTPGFFGPFEIAAVAGLGVYGVSKNLAVAWALSYHVLSLVPITVIGLYYVAKSGLHLSQLRQVRP